MLNIFLCEDNEKQREYFSNIIKKIILIEKFDLQLSCVTADPQCVLNKINEITGTGIYFLDIDLHNNMNGLALAQHIRQLDPRGFIVFVTTHSEMSYMTFTYKVEAMDFIIKDNPKILQDRIHQCIVDAYHKYTSPRNLSQKTFTMTTADKEYCIPLNEIIFFETSENIHKVLLHTSNKILEFSSNMKNLENSLDGRFYRCHRSFIINREHIQYIDFKNRTIIMSNQEVCLASEKHLKKLKK